MNELDFILSNLTTEEQRIVKILIEKNAAFSSNHLRAHYLATLCEDNLDLLEEIPLATTDEQITSLIPTYQKILKTKGIKTPSNRTFDGFLHRLKTIDLLEEIPITGRKEKAIWKLSAPFWKTVHNNKTTNQRKSSESVRRISPVKHKPTILTH